MALVLDLVAVVAVLAGAILLDLAAWLYDPLAGLAVLGGVLGGIGLLIGRRR